MRQMFFFAIITLQIVAAIAAGPALAEPGEAVKAQARRLRMEMRRRGSAEGEIDLALAWVFARGNHAKGAYYFIKQARKHGIAAGRTGLLLGTFYRQQGRHDAAFSTLVRILVEHPDQPYALVQLWKTLYEVKLQGAKTSTDTSAIRDRLANLGLYFPTVFKPKKISASRSRELSASAYNALLSGKTRFASELFEAAVDAFPSNPIAHRGLGIARARGHDFTRAAGAYLLYLELKPQASDAEEVDRMLMEYWKHKQPPGK